MTLSAQTIGSPPRKHGVDRYIIRRPDRLHISLPATIACENDSPVPIHLRNISNLGFMGACARDVPVGCAVAIELPGIGLARGLVRWTIGHKIGGSFNSKIDLDLLREAAPDAF